MNARLVVFQKLLTELRGGRQRARHSLWSRKDDLLEIHKRDECTTISLDEEMALVSVSDFEKKAEQVIPKNAFDYYRSGAGDEVSLKLNRSCFDTLRIRPKCLRDVSKRDLSPDEIFGIKPSLPLGISPTAMQRMAHPDGELANARAAEKEGIIFILSTIATSSIEEVAQAAPKANKWFQLYIYTDRSVTESLIRRAEKCGYKAIVLTVDTPMFGLRRADMRNNFYLPAHLKMANFEGENSIGVESGKDGVSGLNKYISGKFDPSLTWDDVKWLANFTKLPVIVKGVLRADDAIKAVECGCKGVFVSNHGARQIDGVPASIEALPEIVNAVGDRAVVVMDGGITSGTDIFKALALGAKMVFMGRPALWGLGVDGQKGVEKVIQIIRNEFDVCMAITGCPTTKHITRDMVVHESYYQSKL